MGMKSVFRSMKVADLPRAGRTRLNRCGPDGTPTSFESHTALRLQPERLATAADVDETGQGTEESLRLMTEVRLLLGRGEEERRTRAGGMHPRERVDPSSRTSSGRREQHLRESVGQKGRTAVVPILDCSS
jgi:hypothetical protein